MKQVGASDFAGSSNYSPFILNIFQFEFDDPNLLF